MTDIGNDGIKLPILDLSTISPGSEDDRRFFYHSGTSSISLVGGTSTSDTGLYLWNNSESLWEPFSDSGHVRYSDSEAVSAVNGEISLSVDISGDANSVDGYDIQKDGTDGVGIINFKTV